jgi:hypothetical protein
MSATVTKIFRSCREQHVFFLAIGNAVELAKRYEYTCPRNRTRVQFEPAKTDVWKQVDSKVPGSDIIREIVARA